LGSTVQDLGFRVRDFGFGHEGNVITVDGSRFRVSAVLSERGNLLL
jgi:hypothetical protein